MIGLKKLVVVVITALSFLVPTTAQVSNNVSEGSFYLGKIPVYKFKMDSLSYHNDKTRLSAVGTEFKADLYSSRIGDNTYFQIVIDGDRYAVVSNPYGRRVSSEDYYAAWLWKDGKYVSIPQLDFMAGTYFLALPYSKTDEKKVPNTTNNNTTSSSSTTTSNKQIDWQLMGKVRVVYDMRTTRSGGEDDVIYDDETAFLYSAFDGEKTKYKITIPKYGSQYDVYENGSYNGAKVQWDRHGKRIWHLPSLSEMYTHRAGQYYFNVDAVSQ